MNTNLDNSAVKNHIEVEGIILTPEAIKQIAEFQARDNEEIEQQSKVLSQAVCQFVEIKMADGPDFDKRFPEVAEIVNWLIIIRRGIENLKKP